MLLVREKCDDIVYIQYVVFSCVPAAYKLRRITKACVSITLPSSFLSTYTIPAAGLAIGVVGDAGVRAVGQQSQLYVGMILILVRTLAAVRVFIIHFPDGGA